MTMKAILICAAWSSVLVLTSLNLRAEDPKFATNEVDGKISEVYFYGPSKWLSTPGKRLGRFPDLNSITLACGKIGIDEMKYLATVHSLESISTMELPEDAVTFEPGSLNELRSMTWLKDLEIHLNTLPEHEWQFLSKLHQLEGLTLDGIDDSGLKHIQGSTSLTYLSLWGDAAETLPSTIGTLANLTHLQTFARNSSLPLADESLNMLSRLPKLRSLQLDGISASGMERISSFVNLEELTLSSVSRQADISLLRALRNLREINLDVVTLGPNDLAFLSNRSELRLFILRWKEPNYETIQNVSFEQMANLEIIIVSSKLEKDVLAKIAKLPKLKYLSIGSLGEVVDAAADAKAELLRKGVHFEVNGVRLK